MAKKIFAFSLFAFFVHCHGCSCKNASQSLADNTTFTNAKYNNIPPLAALINMPAFSELSQSFSIDTDQEVQVYAVGELLYGLSENEKLFYLEGDDIELFFTTESASFPKVKHFIFSYGDDKKKFRDTNIFFKWNNVNDEMYISEIKIPWASIDINKLTEQAITDFSVAVGDNDDGFTKKTIIGWSAKNPFLSNSHENKKTGSGNRKNLYKGFIKGAPLIDGIEDNLWSTLPEQPIDSTIYGFVKDKFDLSASLKYCWDNVAVYMLVKVRDSRQKKIMKKKIKERNLFTDYGWIENKNGDTIWQMHPKHSSWAGGSYKNQKADTVLYLKKGEYSLKYISDESHSYGNWTMHPPLTPFYGIKLFKKK